MNSFPPPIKLHWPRNNAHFFFRYSISFRCENFFVSQSSEKATPICQKCLCEMRDEMMWNGSRLLSSFFIFSFLLFFHLNIFHPKPDIFERKKIIYFT